MRNEKEILNIANNYLRMVQNRELITPFYLDLIGKAFVDGYKYGQEDINEVEIGRSQMLTLQIEEQKELIKRLREDIKFLADYAEIDVDENGGIITLW